MINILFISRFKKSRTTSHATKVASIIDYSYLKKCGKTQDILDIPFAECWKINYDFEYQI